MDRNRIQRNFNRLIDWIQRNINGQPMRFAGEQEFVDHFVEIERHLHRIGVEIKDFNAIIMIRKASCMLN